MRRNLIRTLLRKGEVFGFHHYPSVVLDRIEETDFLDLNDRSGDDWKLFTLYSDVVEKSGHSMDNKTVLEIRYYGLVWYVGFYDNIMSVGFGVRPNNW